MPKETAATRQLTLNHEPEAVRYARESAGLKQKDAAQKIGISATLLADIEAGRRNATPATLQAMAAAYDCPRVILVRKGRWQ